MAPIKTGIGKLGTHQPRITLDQRTQAAQNAVQSATNSDNRSAIGLMDESNGPPAWATRQD